MSEVPQRRPQRAVWVFPEAVHRYKARRAAPPPSLAGYLCEQCQDAAAVQWQPAPVGWRDGGVSGLCSRRTRRRAPGGVCMAELTISEAAQACGVNRSTLQRAVQAGRLSLTQDHRVDTAELLRAGFTLHAAPLPQVPRAAGATGCGAAAPDCRTLPHGAAPAADMPQETAACSSALRHWSGKMPSCARSGGRQTAQSRRSTHGGLGAAGICGSAAAACGRDGAL